MGTKTTKISLSTINKVLAYSKNRDTLKSLKEAADNFIGLHANGTQDKVSGEVAVQIYCAGKPNTQVTYDSFGYQTGGASAHWRRVSIPKALLTQAIDACLEKQAKEMEDLGVDVDI